MYGYVRPHIPELKVGEYERYRAVYCGLCRSMGRLTGQASRISGVTPADVSVLLVYLKKQRG